MNNAHFIDLDVILKTESKPWIVSKENPNIPILKIDPSDFRIFQSGIYRNQNNKIEFNGKTFWLSNEVMNKVKLAAKKYKADLSNLAISLPVKSSEPSLTINSSSKSLSVCKFTAIELEMKLFPL